MKKVDARGRSCPEPVVMARKAILADAEGAEVLVDNPTAAENITRFATNADYQVRREENGEEIKLVLTKQ